ncbi:hypothetical protein [Streptomyces dysideae]|uniref:Uncharacterized protein n=1 Tax=Streptomyces dysideae TaxID=909626 RepID=A0A101UZ22_9ACTN|nr:hypothetical protein [Streptomyces dysideae]KUO19453.1 hypothetical protein AQJ91_19840 [Streptomyces dysideae]
MTRYANSRPGDHFTEGEPATHECPDDYGCTLRHKGDQVCTSLMLDMNARHAPSSRRRQSSVGSAFQR